MSMTSLQELKMKQMPISSTVHRAPKEILETGEFNLKIVL